MGNKAYLNYRGIMMRINICKILKWIMLSFLGLILVLIIGLIINNRMCAAKYNKLNTNAKVLTKDEISAIKDVYEFLDSNGNDIFKGLKENKDLVIFNDSYEFLISDNKDTIGWNFISDDRIINKKIYSRKVNNPQAFAVSVNDKWIGSMSTKNTFNKSIVNTIPIFFPPQIMIMDDEQYKATIIHEITHAYEATNNPSRFKQIQKLHNVCSNYYNNQTFEKLITKEAYNLEQASKASKREDVLAYSKKFLETREKRRTECKMSAAEIKNEMDFEWLEGLARYVEYKVSTNSNSLVVKNLLNISQKVKEKGDHRYYALGMAQALILDKLQKDWKNDLFTENFSMEEYLKKIIISN